VSKSAAKAQRASGRLLPPAGGAAIRMYRQGLGDSFLLAFATAQRRSPCYVLIDCGAHFAQRGGKPTMHKVVDDIIRATGGRLHVVVATHEHSDHLSAFTQEARRLLSGDLKIDLLWLPWTEDPRDAQATELRRARGWATEAVQAALERLKQQAGADRRTLALAGAVGAAASFFDMNVDAHGDETLALARRLGLNEAKVSGNELALALLRDCAANVRYLQPGGPPLEIPGSPAARAYVLGPPRDEAQLRKSDPSGGDRHETYLTSSSAMPLAAALGVPLAGGEVGDRCLPFDSRYRIGFELLEEAGPSGVDDATRALLRECYGWGNPDHPQAWRRIDSEWLFAIEQLALHLDRHTNNTSLVLAFELGASGRGPVLMFPADAQVGSWLSWQALRWDVAGRSFGAADLFARTLVYKVGHHGSHNATLKRDAVGGDYGLALMPDGLVALIPVDEAVAGKLPGWEMPFARLYEVLLEKTRGNILRSDDDHGDDLPVPRLRLSEAAGQPRVQWRRAQAKKAEGGGPLFYDLMIQGAET
jgi:hypothetical protein